MIIRETKRMRVITRSKGCVITILGVPEMTHHEGVLMTRSSGCVEI